MNYSRYCSLDDNKKHGVIIIIHYMRLFHQRCTTIVHNVDGVICDTSADTLLFLKKERTMACPISQLNTQKFRTKDIEISDYKHQPI